MGQVYRARDTRLNRDVALKILPDSVAHDSDRLTRSTREVQTRASLSHPNIAHIHELEEPAACARWCWSWWTVRICRRRSELILR
jgi:serine/threonine-protein kinase